MTTPPDPGGAAAEVDVVVINWNGARYLPRCLDALLASRARLRVLVVDNASEDGSADYLRRERADVELVALPENRGYAGAANEGLRRGSAPYAFVMNPDLLVEPDHLSRLRDRLDADHAIGAAQGKLYHIDEPTFVQRETPEANVIDSAGQRISRTRMAFDRGQGEPDSGQYDDEVSVFSACGAGLFLRRAMLLDVGPAGHWLDEAFFAYKEDIDLCWRARLHGWDIRFVPDAVAHHVRGVPGNDRAGWKRLSKAARRHSWKNHQLMLIKNDRLPDLLSSLPHVLAWEIARLGHALLREPTLFGAYAQLARCLPAALRARSENLAVARRGGVDLKPWFGADHLPSAFPADRARVAPESPA
ncbi:MAG TPA: glycosyltransferase family 2 protein [Longimicrobiales bacterium]|nr:glycosyltransferase family 2 protein [Longimicrobiales bacterium]